MPEGIAKTATNVNEAPAQVPDNPSLEGFNTDNFNGIPIDIYRMFDMDIGTVSKKDIDTLGLISDWAKNESTDIGDAMQKIRSLERVLGVPRGGEIRITRLFNWIKISNQINDLDKRRTSLTNRGM